MSASKPHQDKQVGPQVERFKEAARELGCDESEERFREVVGKLAKAPPTRNEPSKARKREK